MSSMIPIEAIEAIKEIGDKVEKALFPTKRKECRKDFKEILDKAMERREETDKEKIY